MKPDWYPEWPSSLFPTCAKVWDTGVQAGIKAALGRYLQLIDDPACQSFRQSLAQVMGESGVYSDADE